MATAEAALYLDSSALVKLIVQEEETRALRTAIAGRNLVSSALAIAEVPRAIRRYAGDRTTSQLARAMEKALRGIAYVPVGIGVLIRAGSFEEPFLRTLDAIHVASALEIADDIDSFITYDSAQAKAAGLAGLPLLQPS